MPRGDEEWAQTVDMRLLRAFVTIAKVGSINRAAARLGYSQPGVTHQLKDLERRLGVVLFQRGTTPLRLTPAGRARLGIAEAILDLERCLTQEHEQDRDEPSRIPGDA